jgi:hypothetical protein
MKLFIRTVKVGGTILLFLFLNGCFDEAPERFYSNYTEAVKAGELLRGWLPEWVPRDAERIYIQGDLDNNAVWLRFELSGASADSLKSSCSPLDPIDVKVRYPSNDWWFTRLTRQKSGRNQDLYASLYRAPNNRIGSRMVIAFDKTSNTVFVWSEQH